MEPITNRPEVLIVHHSAVSREDNPYQFYSINQYHKQIGYPLSRFGFYCGYTFVVEPNGAIIRTRYDAEEGAHTLLGWNQKSIGICLTGDFYKEAPTEKQLRSLRTLIKKYNLPYLFHKEADIRRTCAGRYLTHDIIDTETPPIDDTDKAKAIALSQKYNYPFEFLLKVIRSLKK